MSKIYFDIGANNGDTGIPYLNLGYKVYGFEPTPRLCNIIKSKIQNNNNYVLVDKAVSNFNGKSTFYISGQADWGCSSLNKFNDNLSDTWPGRTDFKITDNIEIDVIRLDDFCRDNKIDSIDYLHVDAQGNDLEVLMGLGEYLKIVKKGVIEMPTSHNTKLYKDQKYIDKDAVLYLEQNGFNIDKIESNDCFKNEVNIYFTNNIYNI